MKLRRAQQAAVISLYPGIMDNPWMTLVVFGRRTEMLSTIQLPVPSIGPDARDSGSLRRTAAATAAVELKRAGYEVTGEWHSWQYCLQATVKRARP